MEDFEYYDELFKNVWKRSVTDAQLQEMLSTMSIEAWELVKAHRNDYSNHIKNLIYDQESIETIGATRIKVVEVDNETWYKMMREEIIQKEKQFIERWQKHKKEHKLCRPRSSLDDERDKIKEDIETLNKSLVAVQEVQAKKYVAPSQRRNELPKNKAETELISKIGFLQNELKNIGDRIVKEENEWEYYSRRDYEHKQFLKSNKAYYGM